MGIADARKEAMAALSAIHKGGDPVAAKRTSRAARAARASAPTVASRLEEWQRARARVVRELCRRGRANVREGDRAGARQAVAGGDDAGGLDEAGSRQADDCAGRSELTFPAPVVVPGLRRGARVGCPAPTASEGSGCHRAALGSPRTGADGGVAARGVAGQRRARPASTRFRAITGAMTSHVRDQSHSYYIRQLAGIARPRSRQSQAAAAGL